MRTLAQPEMDPDSLIETLGLKPHPEGGHFCETFRDDTSLNDPDSKARAHSTAIYYLLKAGEQSHWHRVDAAEIWHWYAGSPLRLSLAINSDAQQSNLVLGPDVLNGERPQRIIPANAWQAAASMGAWTLVGCTVAPGFEFEHFEMAEPNWQPGPQSKAG
jgi:uncharacterized protein